MPRFALTEKKRGQTEVMSEAPAQPVRRWPIDLLPEQEQQSQRTKPSMGHDARPIPRLRRWRWLLAAAACALLVIGVRHFLSPDGMPAPRAGPSAQIGAP